MSYIYGYKPFRLPSEMNEIVRNVGIWFIFVGILSIIGYPIQLFINFVLRPQLRNITQISELKGIISFVVALLFIVLIFGFFEIIALFKTRRLKDVSKEGLFSTGAILTIIGLVMGIIFIFILELVFLRLLSVITYNEPISYEEMESMIFLILMAFIFLIPMSIISFIGKIMIAIAFWRFGSSNNSDAIKVGAILYVFISFLGYLLIGYKLKDLADRGFQLIRNEAFTNLIKDKLIRDFPEGMPIDLRTFAKQNDIPTYILMHLVNYWLFTGEIDGYLSDHILVIRKPKSEQI